MSEDRKDVFRESGENDLLAIVLIIGWLVLLVIWVIMSASIGRPG